MSIGRLADPVNIGICNACATLAYSLLREGYPLRQPEGGNMLIRHAFAIALLALVLAACENEETVGEQTGEAIDQAGEQAEEAAEAAREQLEEAGDRIEQATD
jgi:hypothetical protein